MRDALSVDQPSGERWDLAVDLLERGQGFVSLGPLLLYRVAGGPRPDERVKAEICSNYGSDRPPSTHAEAEIAAGLRALDAAMEDPRVAQLVERHGLVREYVQDYGTGRSLLATINADGSLTWRGESDRP
jgi:hypothetical protein